MNDEEITMEVELHDGTTEVRRAVIVFDMGHPTGWLYEPEHSPTEKVIWRIGNVRPLIVEVG